MRVKLFFLALLIANLRGYELLHLISISFHRIPSARSIPGFLIFAQPIAFVDRGALHAPLQLVGAFLPLA